MKTRLLFLFIFIITNLFSQENNVEGLTVEFKSITYDTISFTDKKIIPGFAFRERIITSKDVIAPKGMIFLGLRVVFKNDGIKNCRFSLKDIYLSTEQDSLYQFVTLEGMHDFDTKIKPEKKIGRVLIFEFPEKAIPKELFIEDRRYKVLIVQK